MVRNRVIPALLLAGALAASACTTVRPAWPFGKAPVLAPQAVHELDVSVPAGQSMPIVLQYWERNTLVLDLQAVPATGQFQLARQPGGMWPVRMALRVTPSRFDAVELRGAQRLLAPISAGSGAVTIPVPGGVYNALTGQLTVKWGPSASF